MMHLRGDSRSVLLTLTFGNNMAKIEEEEKDIEIPTEEDENVGDGMPKKKAKRKKSKEERVAERRVIFWTLLVVMVITLGFWLAPKIKGIFRGEPVEMKIDDGREKTPGENKTEEKKNYVEITL